ncbi:atherin-like [Zalophus californianus]|uniref:Atherin-like n=1 Tax=Zalophus californianus TaxID=9704 RepID=A0A6P9FLL9_ZALCA|nr:atherin-like [Zalophus californianus]
MGVGGRRWLSSAGPRPGTAPRAGAPASDFRGSGFCLLGKGPAGAALGSAVAAPAVWRRTGASGAPPAGTRSSPGRASSRGSFGPARCARGLGGPRVAAAPELVRRGLAGGAVRAPARLPSAPPRLLPLAVEASAVAGYTERAGARAEPSPSRCRRRRRRRRSRAPLPSSLPARRPGCGGRRAGGTRAGERRALGLAPKTGPSAAREMDQKTQPANGESMTSR